jgi:hypothetical protein
MAETAEERARLVAERLGKYSAGWLRLKPQVVIDAMNQQQGIIVSEIRSAVAAQKERDAVLAEKERHTIQLYGESIDESVAFVQRCIAAAIRASE